MKLPTAAELAFWNDADDLLNALYRVSREPVPELRAALERLLDHDDAYVREEALRILLTRWKESSLRIKAVTALHSDPAANVQAAAAVAIAATADASSRARDTELLLHALLDQARDLDARGAAYDALIILHRKGAGSGIWPFPTHAREFDPAQDVDWEWVRGISLMR